MKGFLFATQKGGGKQLDQEACTANYSDLLAFPVKAEQMGRCLSGWNSSVCAHGKSKRLVCTSATSDIHHIVSHRACGFSQHLHTQQHPHPHTAWFDKVVPSPGKPACYLKNPNQQDRGGGRPRTHRRALPGVGKCSVATSLPSARRLPVRAPAAAATVTFLPLGASALPQPKRAGRSSPW